MRYGVGASALKRDVIAYDDIMFVVRTGDYLGPIRGGLVWWIGETPSGLGIEVAGFTPDDDHSVIIINHAMPTWRKR